MNLLDKKIIKKLEEIVEKYNYINNQIENIDTKNYNKIKNLMKEKSSIEKIVDEYLNYKKTEFIIKESKDLLKAENDFEFLELIKEDIKINEQKIEKNILKIKKLLISKDPNDNKNVIVEVRGAVGGDEANIFAGDLYRMYFKYAETQK